VLFVVGAEWEVTCPGPVAHKEAPKLLEACARDSRALSFRGNETIGGTRSAKRGEGARGRCQAAAPDSIFFCKIKQKMKIATKIAKLTGAQDSPAA